MYAVVNRARTLSLGLVLKERKEEVKEKGEREGEERTGVGVGGAEIFHYSILEQTFLVHWTTVSLCHLSRSGVGFHHRSGSVSLRCHQCLRD